MVAIEKPLVGSTRELDGASERVVGTASGDLVATWTTLPEHDQLLLAVHGTTADGKTRELELELSQRFAAATGATSATLDTDLPGHQAAWRPDFSREHLRELSVVRDREGVHTASSISKLVNAQPFSQALKRRLAR